jgi:mono/diheme cytochrome c family protein
LFSPSFPSLIRSFFQVLSISLLVITTVAAQEGESPPPGRRLYEQYCAVCHDLRGDGQGASASHLHTKPRDFTKGTYKFKSTPSGSPPLDEDLIRSIRRGIPGTAMVPQDFFSEANLHDLVSYMKNFSPRLVGTKLGNPIALPRDSSISPERIPQGKLAYQKSQCIQCHGLEGKGDGVLSKDLTIKPANFTKRPLKSGPTPQDIVRTILTGLEDTPMPPYQFIVEDKDIWNIAYYIESLGGAPQQTEDEKIGLRIVEKIRKNSESDSVPLEKR